MPCNIVIIDNEDDSTKVVFPKAKTLLEVTDNKSLMDLSIKVDNLLEKAFNKIN